MLLSRGRIETTVINFLPMVVSWLCILGFMALAGIPFNLINIIISTFIFGLGDDYSIFILDGLETEYKYGNKLLSSYKSAILLSAITTMIGLGALLFAEHPALKSIATIGVLGILVVIIVSFVIQPLLYNWMILNRSKRGLPPYNALNMLITLVGFGVFTLGSISLTISGLVLFYIIPISKTKKRLAFHKMLMHLNRVILGIFVNVKKNIITTEDIPVSKQAIMIANHQSHIDLALIMQLHPKLIIFTNDWVWNSPFYGKIVKMADFYPASKGYEQAAIDLKPLIDEGYSVMIFPEGTRSVDGHIHRFHKGAFYLQEILGLDILPVLIHGAGDCVTKGDFHFKQGRLTVKILPRISADNTTPGLSYKDRCKWTNQYLRNEYALLKQEHETESYFKSRLIANYIYKGPVLEWYTRVKIGMESYYQMFNQMLPKTGTITDVGCGYGYLAYMLKYTSPERSIFAMDYDEDKISVAQNNYSNRKLGISFEAADINEYTVNPSDGIVALDILHYLTPEQQVNTINKLMNALNPKGILIIRDANVDYKKKHMFTRYTEFFSTKSGFNKTKPEGLSFLSSGLIEKTVAQNGNFTCEIIDNTRYLSNLVYIIKPKAEI
jgi:1-acyl-sn-glycerol-3-phosphate acyltransferase